MSKPEMINTGNDKRFIRRDHELTFKESFDVSPSLSAEARSNAENDGNPGQGDNGDRKHLAP